ncbi:MAG TPA: hypothetical protein VK971_10445 [Thiohalobacter sp.]|nr:hypothetical protein [Thiohalobacter sp.]
MDIMARRRTAMRPFRVATVLLVLVSGHGVAQAGQETDPAVKPDRQERAEPSSSRLKFRSRGPACMCLSGLSEADIQAAQSRREEGAEKLESIIQDQ